MKLNFYVFAMFGIKECVKFCCYFNLEIIKMSEPVHCTLLPRFTNRESEVYTPPPSIVFIIHVP